MSKANFQNFNIDVPTTLGGYLSLSGAEFTAEWIELAIAAGTKKYLRVILDPDKYTLFNFRALQMDQERGFYRAFTVFTGGAKTGDVNIQKVRPDSPINTGGTIEIISTPATIDLASRIVEIPLFGASGQGNHPITGDLETDDSIRVLPPGGVFLIEFENASAAAAYFRLEFKWWEVSQNFLPEAKSI